MHRRVMCLVLDLLKAIEIRKQVFCTDQNSGFYCNETLLIIPVQTVRTAPPHTSSRVRAYAPQKRTPPTPSPPWVL